ncbi:MAG: tRNA (N6-isopentenyl adenosine(37)-C2)-methylthiotransferase MiaB, partial [Saprospiraceae bacterium]|nr:tRNA (N6-isopentenyl adenosine(37)-C2)-methylthiotransferase MiaB [Saprospiraceae bacterium]
MFDFPTSEKIMDELRQGEVFEPVKGNESQPGLSYYIESYGCQMNFSDSEIVASILEEEGYSSTRNLELADLILLNTCSIREKAEETIRKRLRTFDKIK